MTWQPGLPVLTAGDRNDWQAWRKARKLESQRHRRALYARIDYYPSDDALRVIRGQPGDYSRAIDTLVLAGAGELPE